MENRVGAMKSKQSKWTECRLDSLAHALHTCTSCVLTRLLTYTCLSCHALASWMFAVCTTCAILLMWVIGVGLCLNEFHWVQFSDWVVIISPYYVLISTTNARKTQIQEEREAETKRKGWCRLAEQLLGHSVMIPDKDSTQSQNRGDQTEMKVVYSVTLWHCSHMWCNSII